ncbi:hypothetical protein FKM82_021187 [Ascaphus truei]
MQQERREVCCFCRNTGIFKGEMKGEVGQSQRGGTETEWRDRDSDQGPRQKGGHVTEKIEVLGPGDF